MIRKNKIWFILGIILFLGFLLRYHNIYTWPRHGATFDEFAWTWQGINLIQTGTPLSWSPHVHYTDYEIIKYQGADFRLVKPFLEHPPVFGLVAGSFALLNGVSDMYHVTISSVRPLALILGVLSISLVFLLTRILYDKKTAILASLLYAVIPTVAVGSRIVQNENFFIPAFLFSLYFVAKYIKTKRILFRNIALVLCGVLVLAKIPWIAAGFSIFLIFLYLRRFKDALLFFAAPIIGVIIFAIYGFYYDGELFIKLWSLQIARYDLTFTSFFALFQKPYLIDRFMLDGWIYFGWFTFAMLTTNIKKNFIIIFGLVGYLVIFIAGIPDEPGHGWYRYPLYPFLVISIALFIKDQFNKNYILTFLFLIFTSLSLLELTWKTQFGFSFLVFRGAIILCMVSLVPLFFPRAVRIVNLINLGLLSIIILLSMWTILLYNEF